MKKVLAGLLAITLIVFGTAAVWSYTKRVTDKKIIKFNEDADNLLMGLQQYKEFTGGYPAGSSSDISKALFGQTQNKVMILAVRKSDLNSKGEIIDPWGTPFQFFFMQNTILIRSAGPNKAFDDSKAVQSDDLFRTN
jgi:hypothetical protein